MAFSKDALVAGQKCRNVEGISTHGQPLDPQGRRSRPPRALLVPPKALLLLVGLLFAVFGSASAQTGAADYHSPSASAPAAEAINYLSSIGIRGTYCFEDADPNDVLSSHLIDQLKIRNCSKIRDGVEPTVRSPHRRMTEGPEESNPSAFHEGCSCSGGEEEEFHGGDANFYLLNGGMAAICVTMAALAAGLTMGLLSLDPLMLLIKIRAGANKAERDQAASLLPIVQQHHRLLVSLLLMNACANEALPLFLDKLVPSYVAVILSVTLVLFFGEIIPSAVFTGPNQLKIASSLVPLVRTIMFVLSPIAYPIAKMLDVVLHDEEESHGMNMYNRGELTALVRIQFEERMASKQRRKAEMAKLVTESTLRGSEITSDSLQSFRSSVRSLDSLRMRGIKHGLETHWLEHHETFRASPSEKAGPGGSRLPLVRAPSWHHDEVTLVEGALQMKSKRAIDCYTPMREVFTIPNTMVLNETNVVQIYSRGYSRVPVYVSSTEGEDNNLAICGILITKQLIVVNTSDQRVVSTMPLLQPFCISPSTNLVDLINIFQAGGTDTTKGGHMALLCAHPGEGNAALDKGEPIPASAGIMGVITLEDVLEELLQEEILDELDRSELESMRRAQWAASKWKRFVKNKKAGRTQDGDGASDASLAETPTSFFSLVGQVTKLAGGSRSTSAASNTGGNDLEAGDEVPSSTAALLDSDDALGSGYIYGTS